MMPAKTSSDGGEPLEREFVVAGGHVALGNELVASGKAAERALGEAHRHLVVGEGTDGARPLDGLESALDVVVDSCSRSKFARQRVVEDGRFGDGEVQGRVTESFQHVGEGKLLPRCLTELYHTLLNVVKKNACRYYFFKVPTTSFASALNAVVGCSSTHCADTFVLRNRPSTELYQ